MKTLFIAFGLLLLVGCSAMPGMPGYISKTESSYNGAIQYDMEPGFVYRGNDSFSGADLFMSLSWNTKMKDDILLIAHISRLSSILRSNSLHFMIDGDEVSLSSIGTFTDRRYEPGVYSTTYIPGTSYASRTYVVKVSFIERLINANDVRVKLDTSDGYVSGYFSNDTTSSAVSAFRDFMEKVKG